MYICECVCVCLKLTCPSLWFLSLPTEILGLFAESLYRGDGAKPRFPETVETDRGLVFGDGSSCSSDSDLGDLLEDEPPEDTPTPVKTEVD